MVESSKQPTSRKIILVQMTGSVVISEVHVLLQVVLSEAEKHVPYGKLDGTKECIALQARYGTNQGRCNRVQLYFNLTLSTIYHNEFANVQVITFQYGKYYISNLTGRYDQLLVMSMK